MAGLDFFTRNGKTEAGLSVLKDPFALDCIKNVHIWIENKASLYGKPVRITVEFENGKTEGKQRFDGEDLAVTAAEAQAFIDSLKNKGDS